MGLRSPPNAESSGEPEHRGKNAKTAKRQPRASSKKAEFPLIPSLSTPASPPSPKNARKGMLRWYQEAWKAILLL